MFSVAQEWNGRQKHLKELLARAPTWPEGLSLCREMHAQLHQFSPGSIFSRLIDGLPPAAFAYQNPAKFETMVWDIWHITRIEDAVANLLIAGSSQIFDPAWGEAIGASIKDTGNAMTAVQVAEFTQSVKVDALLDYRRAVGRNSQKLLSSLQGADLRAKPNSGQLQDLLDQEIITNQPESLFLKDFWGNKTIIGLLLMPITRHQIVHINDCFAIKEKFLKTSPAAAQA